MPTRYELQVMAEKRLEAVKSLHKQGFYDFVCQDSGYVLEFGLKSAVCKRIGKDSYPDNDQKYRTHSLNKLVNLADLRRKLERKKKKDENFFVNWSIASKWSVEFRYQPIGQNEKENAEDFLNAIENPKDGVHPWVKENW